MQDLIYAKITDFLAEDPDGPVVMLNLLRFSPTADASAISSFSIESTAWRSN